MSEIDEVYDFLNDFKDQGRRLADIVRAAIKDEEDRADRMTERADRHQGAQGAQRERALTAEAALKQKDIELAGVGAKALDSFEEKLRQDFSIKASDNVRPWTEPTSEIKIVVMRIMRKARKEAAALRKQAEWRDDD